MSSPSSNMISKNYCPKCESFDMVKVHRNFIQKRIFNSPNKLECQACHAVLKPNDFTSNPAKELPIFIETVIPENQPSIQPDFLTNEGNESVVEMSQQPLVKTKQTNWGYALFGLAIFGGLGYIALDRFPVKDGILTSLNLQPAPITAPVLQAAEAPLNKVENTTPEQSMVTMTQAVSLQDEVSPLTQEPSSETNENTTLVEIKDNGLLVAESEKNLEPVPELDSLVVLDPATEELVTVPMIETKIKFPSDQAPNPDQDNKVKIETSKASTIKSDELLEKAAVEFMKQDLDSLFK